VILYGAGTGLRSILRGTLPLALFGAEGYAVLMGRLAFPILIAQSAAPSLGAIILDHAGAAALKTALFWAAVANVALAALLPLLLLLRRRLPPVRPLRDAAGVLPQLLVASFTLFFLAHLLLFRLYLPGRFVRWSLPIVLCIAAGLALAILLELLAARLPPRRRSPLAGAALALALALALYPAHYNGFFVRDRHPTVTAYLRSQPKDILVAGVPSEADFVPTLASRRVLTGREYMFPLYLGYYGEQRQRTEALIEAYYAQSPRAVADFTARYGVDLFLVNRAAFDARKIQDVWGEKFKPFTSTVALALRGAGHFALEEAANRCALFDDGEVAVVPASCLR
jgi:hypothetical protein